VHGFPNLFINQMTQGANLISNVPHNLTEAGKTIAMTIRHALDNGYAQVEVTKDAEDAWLELLLSGPGRMLAAATTPARRAITTTKVNPAAPDPICSSGTPPVRWRTSNTSTAGVRRVISRA